MRQQNGGDAGVILQQIPLGQPQLGPEDLFEIGELDGSSAQPDYRVRPLTGNAYSSRDWPGDGHQVGGLACVVCSPGRSGVALGAAGSPGFAGSAGCGRSADLGSGRNSGLPAGRPVYWRFQYDMGGPPQHRVTAWNPPHEEGLGKLNSA